MSPEEKTSVHRVPGCVSTVWLVATFQDGRVRIRADAESPVVKGLVVLLSQFYDGATPAEINAHHGDLLALAGLTRDLSPTRRNGLAAVHARIKQIAASFA